MADTVTMQKHITCPKCKGTGHITLTRMYNDYCGIGSEPCKNCNATGFLEVPMTNAEQIRAMSDRELADFLSSKFTEVGYLRQNEEGHKLSKIEVEGLKHNLFCVFMKWLKLPAGKDNDE